MPVFQNGASVVRRKKNLLVSHLALPVRHAWSPSWASDPRGHAGAVLRRGRHSCSLTPCSRCLDVLNHFISEFVSEVWGTMTHALGGFGASASKWSLLFHASLEWVLSSLLPSTPNTTTTLCPGGDLDASMGRAGSGISAVRIESSGGALGTGESLHSPSEYVCA